MSKKWILIRTNMITDKEELIEEYSDYEEAKKMYDIASIITIDNYEWIYSIEEIKDEKEMPIQHKRINKTKN